VWRERREGVECPVCVCDKPRTWRARQVGGVHGERGEVRVKRWGLWRRTHKYDVILMLLLAVLLFLFSFIFIYSMFMLHLCYAYAFDLVFIYFVCTSFFISFALC